MGKFVTDVADLTARNVGIIENYRPFISPKHGDT